MHDTIDDLDNLETIPFAPLEELERARAAMRSRLSPPVGWLVARRWRVAFAGLLLGVAFGFGLPALLAHVL